MPLWIIGSLLELYGMAYIVFAFTPPPSMMVSLLQLPPGFSSGERSIQIGRIVVGAVLMIAPLVVAYLMLRT